MADLRDDEVREALEKVMAEVAVNELKQALAENPGAAEEFIASVPLQQRPGETATYSRIRSAPEFEDKVPIYSTKDGSPSWVQIAMIPKALLKRFNSDPDVPEHLWGKPAFSLKQGIDWRHPEFLCMLHPDHERREYFDSIGLAGRICTKATLASDFDVITHLQHKHVISWGIIERARETEKDEHARTVADAQYEAMMALSEAVKALAPRDEPDE